MSILIWLQRNEIKRLRQYFLGRFPADDEQALIYRNNNNHNAVLNRDQNDLVQDRRQEEIEANDGQGQNDFEDAVENPNIIHQGRNINQLINLMFPQILPGFRNITALKAFHKTQREGLKEYQTSQDAIFRQNR